MVRAFNSHPTETWLVIIIIVASAILSVFSEQYLTLVNAFDLLNSISINVIFAVGLLVVLISGGIDISFAVAASVVQYLAFYVLSYLGGGNWVIGFIVAGGLGIVLGFINAGLIHYFRIISIVVTIATFNVFFGLLMFVTKGVSLYDLPDWWTDRIIIFEREMANGSWAELTLPAVVMFSAISATWFLITYTSIGRQIYAFGDNPEGARRIGISVVSVQFSYGWMGMMAGIGGVGALNAGDCTECLDWTGIDVLAAVVLGGAALGGGRGTVWLCAWRLADGDHSNGPISG